MAPCGLHSAGMGTRGGWFGTRLPRPAVAKGPAHARGGAVAVRAQTALIVNTKGGGHANLGINIARQLVAAGHSVTILNDGDKVRRLCRGL